MNHSIFTAVLLGAVCVQAHIDIFITACQTNDTAPEGEVQLDGDEMLYADFKNKDTVITLPEFAHKWENPDFFDQVRGTYGTCINDMNRFIKAENNPPEEIDTPTSTIYSREEVELGKNNSLICFVNYIYPPPVKVKWTKNNVEVKDGVTLSRYYPNPDATFQQFSTLSIIPEEGDVYFCIVEHKGQLLTNFWVPEANNESDTAVTAFCGIGLTLGLLGVGFGTFFLIKGNNCN